MDIVVLVSLISVAMLPLAFVGAIFIVKRFMEFMLTRKGYVKLLFTTPSRQIKTEYHKPESNYIKAGGKKMYRFDPRKIFRWGLGGTPTILYNEESIEPIDPLEKSSKLSPVRLSELLTRWFNLGVLSTIKKEKIIQSLLIIVTIAAIGSVIMSFMAFDALRSVESSIRSDLDTKTNTLLEAVQNIQQTQAATEEIPVIK